MKAKKFISLFIILLCMILGTDLTVRAATKPGNNGEYFNQAGTVAYIPNVVEERTFDSGLRYIRDNGFTTSTPSNEKSYEQKYTNILLQKTDAKEGVKVVSWGAYNQNHSVSNALPRMTLGNLAKDYEKNHPGWKVLAGINADQYCWGYGAEPVKLYDICENRPLYPMKADGETWFYDHFEGGVNEKVTGFLNDGSLNQLVYDPASATSVTFTLTVYDEENNVIGKYDVNDLNPKSKISGEYTYVYAVTDTGNTSLPVDRTKETKSISLTSNNDLYIIGAADKTWVGNSVDYKWHKPNAQNSFFGKGSISSIDKSCTLTATQFAIETTDSELKEVLKVGSYVVAQYELGGDYQKCESAIGWHSIQKLNGIDKVPSSAYNNKDYPRSVFGITSDGTIALINCSKMVDEEDKSKVYSQGLTGIEINALLNAYDVQTAFQMDGGGSATMVVRTEDGEFETVNQPSDGSDRSIYNGLFFVVKDVNYETEVSDVTQDSFELDVNVLEYPISGTVTNTYLNFTATTKNGREFEKLVEVIDGKVSLDGLDSNVEYTYNVQYKVEGSDKMYKSYTYGKITTLKEVPSLKDIRIEIKDGVLQVYILSDDPDGAITSKVSISFDNGETFKHINIGSVVTIEDYESMDIFNMFYIKYNYDINSKEGNQLVTIDNPNIKCNVSLALDVMNFNINSVIDDILE